MSYNPVKAANFYKKNKSRAPLNPHAGTKHSDIVRSNGISSVNQYDRTMTTKSGFSSTLFKDGFIVRTELIMPGNYSGIGVNAKKSRVFNVIRGILYVTTDEGVKQYIQGSFFVAKKNLRYAFASPGTSEVEVLIIEDVGYDKSWELLDNETITSAFGGEDVLAGPANPARVRRSDQTQAKVQSQNLAGKRNRKLNKPQRKSDQQVNNANSMNSTGVNLKPVIPTEE